MIPIGYFHQHGIAGRRIRVLAAHLSPLASPRAHILDVGCGDGALAAAIAKLRPDVEIQGADILSRGYSHIPVTLCDGPTLPFADRTFDCSMVVDVLHHTQSPEQLLREALRVSRHGVMLKDHLREGLFAEATLRLMDWVGNARFGVPLHYHFLSHAQWEAMFANLAVSPRSWNERLSLYPLPLSLFCDRRLHFITYLSRDIL